MSLIVARKINNKFIVVSDTLISVRQGEGEEEKYFEYKHYPNRDQSVVKSILIDPQLVICFAGKNYFAEEALKKIGNNNSLDFVLETLFEFNQKSKNTTDFIVCFGKPHYKMFSIKNNDSKEIETGWIGDKEAFESYQSFYHLDEKRVQLYANTTSLRIERLPNDFSKEEEDVYLKMKKSLIGVIEDPSVNSVGGFIIPIVYEENQFQYIGYMYNFRKPIESDEIEISWGNASDGGFSTNLLNSKKSLVALHFFQGHLGVIYEREGNGLIYPTLISDMDEIDFFHYLKDNKKLNPYSKTTGAITAKHNKEDLGVKGENYLSLGQFQQAIKYFDWAMEVSSKNWGDKEDSTNSFRYLNDYIKTQGEIKISIEDGDTLKKITFHRGQAYELLGQFDIALQNYIESLSIDSKFIPSLTRIGITKGKQKKLSESLCYFNQCISISQDSECYYNRGVLYVQMKDLIRAKEDMELALKINPNYGDAIDALKKIKSELS